jgi:hypothetical protein
LACRYAGERRSRSGRNDAELVIAAGELSSAETRGKVMAVSGKSAARPPELLVLSGLLRPGEGLKFGRHLGGLGRADLPEDLQCLPQEDLGLRGMAGG